MNFQCFMVESLAFLVIAGFEKHLLEEAEHFTFHSVHHHACLSQKNQMRETLGTNLFTWQLTCTNKRAQADGASNYKE